jgi:hypothetical protein
MFRHWQACKDRVSSQAMTDKWSSGGGLLSAKSDWLTLIEENKRPFKPGVLGAGK